MLDIILFLHYLVVRSGCIPRWFHSGGVCYRCRAYFIIILLQLGSYSYFVYFQICIKAYALRLFYLLLRLLPNSILMNMLRVLMSCLLPSILSDYKCISNLFYPFFYSFMLVEYMLISFYLFAPWHVNPFEFIVNFPSPLYISSGSHKGSKSLLSS